MSARPRAQPGGPPCARRAARRRAAGGDADRHAGGHLRRGGAVAAVARRRGRGGRARAGAGGLGADRRARLVAPDPARGRAARGGADHLAEPWAVPLGGSAAVQLSGRRQEHRERRARGPAGRLPVGPDRRCAVQAQRDEPGGGRQAGAGRGRQPSPSCSSCWGCRRRNWRCSPAICSARPRASRPARRPAQRRHHRFAAATRRSPRPPQPLPSKPGGRRCGRRQRRRGGSTGAGGDQDAPLLPQQASQLVWLGLSASTVAALEPYVTVLPGAQPRSTSTPPAPRRSSPACRRSTWRAPSGWWPSARAATSAVSRMPSPVRQGGGQFTEGQHSVATRFFEVRGRLRLEQPGSRSIRCCGATALRSGWSGANVAPAPRPPRRINENALLRLRHMRYKGLYRPPRVRGSLSKC